jgi:hypothetical protein
MVAIYSRIGDRGGDIATGNSTLTALDDGTPFTLTVPAVAGDNLLIQASVQVFTGGSPTLTRVSFSIAGAAILGADAVCSQQTDGGRHNIPLLYHYVVQSGDISGGNVAVVLLVGYYVGVANAVGNDSDWALPSFTVMNLGQ